jgi:excisionase family DNA binding protein
MTEINNLILDDGFERVADAALYLGVSRSLIYKLLNAGVLPSAKIGNSRRIPIRAVRELAAANLTQQPRPDDGRDHQNEEAAGDTAASPELFT